MLSHIFTSLKDGASRRQSLGSGSLPRHPEFISGSEKIDSEIKFGMTLTVILGLAQDLIKNKD